MRHRPLQLLVVLAAAALGLGACRSPAPVLSAAPLPSMAMQAPASDVGALDYAMVVPENVAYVPWKIVGGFGKGLVDGGAAGFTPQRLPLLGLLFLPVNVTVGGVTGLVAGTVSEPAFVGPRDNFGRTMGLPVQRPTPIWWLPD